MMSLRYHERVTAQIKDSGATGLYLRAWNSQWTLGGQWKLLKEPTQSSSAGQQREQGGRVLSGTEGRMPTRGQTTVAPGRVCLWDSEWGLKFSNCLWVLESNTINSWHFRPCLSPRLMRLGNKCMYTSSRW